MSAPQQQEPTLTKRIHNTDMKYKLENERIERYCHEKAMRSLRQFCINLCFTQGLGDSDTDQAFENQGSGQTLT